MNYCFSFIYRNAINANSKTFTTTDILHYRIFLIMKINNIQKNYVYDMYFRLDVNIKLERQNNFR